MVPPKKPQIGHAAGVGAAVGSVQCIVVDNETKK